MLRALIVLGFASQAFAQEWVHEPEMPRDLTTEEWLARFPDREDLRVCANRTGEWTIEIDASARSPARARAVVRSATGIDRQLGRCLEERLRQGLAGAALERRTDRVIHDEHTFRVLDARAIERAYLERRRYLWTAAQERAGLAQCIAGAPANRFPLRVPILITLEGGPFVDWPQPSPAWWVAEETLRNCLSYYLGGVPHIDALPTEHRFTVEVRRDGTVTIAP